MLPVVLNNMDEPVHTVAGPEMVPAEAPGFTVILKDDEEAPHALVTV